MLDSLNWNWLVGCVCLMIVLVSMVTCAGMVGTPQDQARRDRHILAMEMTSKGYSAAAIDCVINGNSESRSREICAVLLQGDKNASQ